MLLVLSLLLHFLPGARAQQDSLRFISYNIHHAGPPSRPNTIDVDAVIRLLETSGADVIALQEVDVNTKRSGGVDQARRIAEGLGMTAYFGKAIDHDGGEYGVALLSRYPMSGQELTRLPMDTAGKGEQRVLITAQIRLLSGRTVRIGCTHLDHRADPKSRLLQVAAIRAVAVKQKEAFILGGDFNDTEGSAPIDSLKQDFTSSCSPCAFTFPAHRPNRTIDFILFSRDRDISVRSHSVIANSDPSDHLAIRTVLQLGK